MKKKMLPILVFMIVALLSVGLANPIFACDFRVHKFNDFNSNGIWELGEPPIEGWNIRIYRDRWGEPWWEDPENWELSAEAVTDTSGMVFFENLIGCSTYRVWEEQVECWEPTTPVSGLWQGGFYTQLYADCGSYHEIEFGNVDTCDGGEGCTPGYWRNHFEDWPPTGYSTLDDFDTTFGVDLFDPDITLGEAIWLGGGGVKKLTRHGTAALLSAAHPDVDYPFTVAEVIASVQTGNAQPLADANELGCPF